MDYPDPGDIYEQDDYDLYESQFQDELEIMEQSTSKSNNIKQEKIDFSIQPTKSQKQLDEALLKGSLKSGVKRTSSILESDEEELMYSDDEFVKLDVVDKEDKKNKYSNEVLPKKLKFDENSNAHSSLGSLSSKLSEMKHQLQRNIVDEADFDELDFHAKRQRVFKRPLLGYDMLNVTNSEGDRVFLKLMPDLAGEKSKLSYRDSQVGLNLLSVPFEELKASVNAKRHADSVLRQTDNEKWDERVPDISETKEMNLWVDKYSPHKYTELLSDDGTNRLLLKWLKLWDNIVFMNGSQTRSKNFKNKNEAGSFHKKQEGKFKKRDFKATFASRQALLEEDLVHDKKGRPKQKIALLCGNPGLGKTTLAHVISKHAGYNVIEMNASDDRSPEMFRNRIESSIQMKSTVAGSKKPNCLIIDEIDGAPVASINILTELCKATETAGAKKSNKGSKGKKKKDFILNRPIICICNDLFVPALRSLRQVAFTLNFPQTLASRLANRLSMIAQVEMMRIDMGSLLLLAEKTENDIRSCLNTLQFIKQKSKEFKPEDIKTMDIGTKDMKKGVRTIITQVFQLPRVNRKKLIGDVNNMGGNAKTGAGARFHYMLHLVSGNADYEKMMQGLFDQYLHCKTKDPYLESITTATEWLCFGDLIQERVIHEQDYVLRRYSIFIPVTFHMYFAKATPQKLQYSNDAYENNIKSSNNMHTLSLMLNGMGPKVRRNCLRTASLLELIPYLFSVTIPNLRPVNMRLYSEMEKRLFTNLVETMMSYNLTFRQERNQEGQYTYILEPNIEELITYTGMAQHKHLAYATKQLIAREIDLERMRKAEQSMKATENSTTHEVMSSTSNGAPVVNPLNNQKLVPKKLDAKKFETSTQLDFFGRVIKTPVKNASSSTTKIENTTNSLLNKKVRFRFNEGYTNAVRRKVKIKDFF